MLGVKLPVVTLLLLAGQGAGVGGQVGVRGVGGVGGVFVVGGEVVGGVVLFMGK